MESGVGVVPLKSTLTLSPIEIAGVGWGGGGAPKYYIRRKLPHVRKELGFCWDGGGRLLEGRDCWVIAGCGLQGLVGRNGAGA